MSRSVTTPPFVPLAPQIAQAAPAGPGFTIGVVSRPVAYMPSVADEICRRIVLGETIRELDADPRMPELMTIVGWCSRYPDFRQRYQQARLDSAHVMEYDLLHIAAAAKTKDEAACARVRADAMKFVMSKRNPRDYGERVDITVRNEPARIPLNFANLSPADISQLRAIVAKSIAQGAATATQGAAEAVEGLGGPQGPIVDV